ncbi:MULTISPECIES: NTP transferase domain-containing protein [Priestia]|uniref:NTP transferase domain-containing protein n=1 Tax=Priestia TaxID=2800373 RepID=UPI002040D16A|nr:MULTISPECIES: NTP transferase domain-containing protein [Priestia]MCM3771062.1 NTP transferase domain-containing protein [Priestia aryabhattai]MDY0942490.1 NTP transferase domain-containing protein [Priestia megaterium]
MPSLNIVAVYLAAGASKRMGSNKLLLPLGNGCLGSKALQTAVCSKVNHTIVVTKKGDHLEWIDPILFSEAYQQKWSHTSCSSALKGQSASLKCGLKKAKKLSADAIIVLLADQPLVSDVLIDTFVSLFEKHSSVPFISSFYQGIARAPVLFSKQMFSSLDKLQGDQGARKIIRQNGTENGMFYECTDASLFIDVDTKQAYERVKKIYKEKRGEKSGDHWEKRYSKRCVGKSDGYSSIYK